jgi:hypothetical protein
MPQGKCETKRSDSCPCTSRYCTVGPGNAASSWKISTCYMCGHASDHAACMGHAHFVNLYRVERSSATVVGTCVDTEPEVYGETKLSTDIYGLLDTRTRFRGTHKYILKYVRKLNQCGARAPAAHALHQIKIPLMFGGMRTYHRRNDQLHPRSFW